MRFTLLFILFSFLIIPFISFGQRTNKFSEPRKATKTSEPRNIQPIKTNKFLTQQKKLSSQFDIQQLKPMPAFTDVSIYRDKSSIWIEGDVLSKTSREKPNDPLAYIKAVREFLLQNDQVSNYTIQSSTTDDMGIKHHKMQQMYQSVPVFGGEIIVHEKNGKITKMNGHVYPIQKEMEDPKLTDQQAMAIGKDQILYKEAPKSHKWLALEQEEVQYSIFVDDQGTPHWAWHVKVIPNIYENWELLVDAASGEILKKWSNICNIMGHRHVEACSHDLSAADFSPPPVIGSGVDLKGESQDLRLFEQDGEFFMFDDSREMFMSYGDEVTPPVGAIVTFEQQGESSPIARSGSADFNDPKAVSAHVNGSIAYEYLLARFQRNSINGQGGSVFSTFNVLDPESGEEFDNAFWNGRGIYYGNGKTVFANPTQTSLDVAGHEMFHGVVQNTANLVYQGESGAINESVADFYGVMIENEDWRVGEDIVNSQFFPSGTMRDMANPNNGGSSFNDFFYQPDRYSQRFTDPEVDNGGVHINSGITNFAFFKIANKTGDIFKTEEMIYRSLNNYLTRNSQFIDLRKAMEQSAMDLYGNGAELTAVQEAFDEVEITGTTTTPPTEVEYDGNPGSNFILYTDGLNDNLMKLVDLEFNTIADPLSNLIPISKPSITDNGSVIVFVASDNTMQFIILDWENGQIESGVLHEDQIWRNVVISRDGSRLAALTTDNDNLIYVFDLLNEQAEVFELYNPTFTDGVVDDNVLYADAMQFDHTGEFLLYDALNEASNTESGNFDYWDIGFLHVFDNEKQSIGSGEIIKLVTGLPDNVSIGNPSFANNSPTILTLDYLELVYDDVFDVYNEEYSVFNVNFETGEAQQVITNNTLSFPSYSANDQFLVFETLDDPTGLDLGRELYLRFVQVGDDKLSLVGDLIPAPVTSYWGVWFANGQRVLTSSEDIAIQSNMSVYPNPVASELVVDFKDLPTKGLSIQISDLLGRIVYQGDISQSKMVIPTNDWSSGVYQITTMGEDLVESQLVMKK